MTAELGYVKKGSKAAQTCSLSSILHFLVSVRFRQWRHLGSQQEHGGRWAADVYLRTSQPAPVQEKRMGEAGNSWTKQQQRTKTIKEEMRHLRRRGRVVCVYWPSNHPDCCQAGVYKCYVHHFISSAPWSAHLPRVVTFAGGKTAFKGDKMHCPTPQIWVAERELEARPV